MASIESDIPNWKRFREKYPDMSDLAGKFENRYSGIAESETKTRLAKLINVELGIALLRETEIDREAFSKMLSAISK